MVKYTSLDLTLVRVQFSVIKSIHVIMWLSPLTRPNFIICHRNPTSTSSPTPAPETSTLSSLWRWRLKAHRGDKSPCQLCLASLQASSMWNAVLAFPFRAEQHSIVGKSPTLWFISSFLHRHLSCFQCLTAVPMWSHGGTGVHTAVRVLALGPHQGAGLLDQRQFYVWLGKEPPDRFLVHIPTMH